MGPRGGGGGGRKLVKFFAEQTAESSKRML